MPQPLRLALGGLGGLVVAVGVVVVTAAAVGFDLTGALSTSPAPSTGSSHVPQPTASAGRAQAGTAAGLVAQAALQAEAEALGVRPRDLTAKLRQGVTVHQLAAQSGISPQDFQGRFAKGLKAILDQDVQQGTLTAQEEQLAMQRLGSRLPPNWDRAAAASAR